MSSNIESNRLRSERRREQIVRLERCLPRRKALAASLLAGMLLAALITPAIHAQEKSAPRPLKGISAAVADMIRERQQTPGARRPITISDAVSIFLQQNLQLVAARYDVDTADAEKLTAKLRPNPQITIGSSGLPLNFSGPFISQQTFSYGVSQTLELGGKRRKRIDAANANSDLAQ